MKIMKYSRYNIDGSENSRSDFLFKNLSIKEDIGIFIIKNNVR